MAQKIYGLIRDCGDGSSSLVWFTDKARVDELLEKEEYYANEGSPCQTITLPDDIDLKAAGFRIYT